MKPYGTLCQKTVVKLTKHEGKGKQVDGEEKDVLK